MIREIAKYSLVTLLMLLLINYVTYVDCPQTSVFNGDGLYFFIIKIFWACVGGCIWVVGYVVFLEYIFRFQAIKKYFITLTIMACLPIVFSIGRNTFSGNRQRIASICEKSVDEDQFSRFRNLTFDEYLYLRDNSYWLPNIPSQSLDVTVLYYRDDFLGDWGLNIYFELPTRIKMDTLEFPSFRKMTDEAKESSGFHIEENIYHASQGQS